MQYKRKSTSATVLAVALALLLAGCATTLGAADSSSSEGTPASVVAANGTAYSRKMDGTVFNWRDTDCSYELDADGNVILSYDDGKTTAKAPLLLSANADDGPNMENTGFFISEEKTAIAYNSMDSCGPITVLTSSDKGRTWETVSIAFDGYLSWMKIGFTTKEQGWLVTCSGPALGAEKHSIYVTSDGGKTWTSVDSDIDEVYGRVLSGAGFVNDKVGFLCFRYETDFQPAICVTRDGGLTWSRLSVNLPKEYDGYNKTPLSPVLEGTEIVLPVLLTDDSGEAGTVYLISEDEGVTWQCKTALSDENTSPAAGETSPIPSAADPAALSAIKAVLLGNAEFYETGIGKTLDISRLNQAVSSDGAVTAKATRFAVIDLDNDGMKEVVLRLQVNGNDDYGSEVLRYQNGVVYGYVMWYRSFNQLKADGTFSFSSSAMDSGFGALSFTDQTCSVDKITYSESSYDTGNNLSVSYFINNKRAAQDEFDAAIKKQDEKPDAVWHDFTNDNIETVLPGA